MTSVQWTGYVLAPLAVMHFAVTRGLPYVVNEGSEGIGLSFVGHGFARHPLLSWLLYTSLVTIGSYHVVKGWAIWLGLPTRWNNIVNGIVVSVSGVWLAAVFKLSRIGAAVGHLGRQYDHLYNSMIKPT